MENVKDKRKIRLEDRLNHLAIQLDVIRICLLMCTCNNDFKTIMEKIVHLCIGDLSHLIEDMNGMRNGEKNGKG